MKKFLDALLPFFGTVLLCLAGCSTSPQPASVNLSPAIANVQSADKSLDAALRTNVLVKKNQAIKEAKQELSLTQTNLVAQQAQAQKLQTQSDWWKNDSETKQVKIQTLETRVSHLDHLLFLCSALISLVAMGIGWELLKNVPFGPWATAGIGATVFATSWFGLGHLL